MNKTIVSSGLILTAILFSGCSQKVQQSAVPAGSIEVTGDSVASIAETKPAGTPQVQVNHSTQPSTSGIPIPTTSVAVNLPQQEESMDPAGSVLKPTKQEIQQALQNAGLYAGTIDGAIGPKTKKAIREFQSQNDLAVDGKIGPKTWRKLAPYLNKASEPPSVEASLASKSN